MNTFIYIDSNKRLPEDKINDFKITASMTFDWSEFPNQISNVSSSLDRQILEYKDTIRITCLVLYFRTNLVDFRIPMLLKINFYSQTYKDSTNIRKMYNQDEDFNFVATYFNNINYLDPIDNSYTIYECKYKSPMIQSIRIKRNGEFKFKLSDESEIVPVDLERIICTFSMMPFINDGHFTKTVIQSRP